MGQALRESCLDLRHSKKVVPREGLQGIQRNFIHCALRASLRLVTNPSRHQFVQANVKTRLCSQQGRRHASPFLALGRSQSCQRKKEEKKDHKPLLQSGKETQILRFHPGVRKGKEFSAGQTTRETSVPTLTPPAP